MLIFLGIPLLAGYLTRTVGERRRGRDWYEQTLLPRIGPIALYGLLFTVVILFALQGDTITSHPLTVALIAVPLLGYFAIMWTLGFLRRAAAEADLPADHHDGVHRVRQRLRTRYRGGHRRVRGHLRGSPGRGRRPADRGAGAARPWCTSRCGCAPGWPGRTTPADTAPVNRPAPVRDRGADRDPTPNRGRRSVRGPQTRPGLLLRRGVLRRRASPGPSTMPAPCSNRSPRISTFLPILVAKQAKEALLSAAQAEGRIVKTGAGAAVRVRAQRRPLPDGRRAGRAPVRPPGPRPLGRVRADRPAQPDRRAGPGRTRHLPHRGLPETADRQRRARRRRHHHHGLRRRLPDLPRQTLRGLGRPRPGRSSPSRPCGRSATTSKPASPPCCAKSCPDPDPWKEHHS